MDRVSDAANASAASGVTANAANAPPGCYTYQVSRHSADLLHSLNQQRKNGGRFCDVLLRVGEESFPAHRAVLAACSEYFESVFSTQGIDDGCRDSGGGNGDGAETRSAAETAPGLVGRELEMHTISSKVFGDILDFAYTSRIVVRLESFPELMTAAKFLLMRSVIDICQEVIKQSNVQILVPPAARPDIMLFRPGTADLGFPLDMTNGGSLAPNGNGIAGMADDDATRAALSAVAQSGLPVLQGVDRLPMVAGPLSPQLLSSPFQNAATASSLAGSKRGRGRPRKANILDSMMFSAPGGLREAGILPCGLCGKVFTDANRLRQHEAQHGVTSLQLGYLDLQPPLVPPRLGENGGVGVAGMDDTASEAPRKRSRTRKQVACEICGKIFRDVYHLNRHKLSHSGEKPYSCPVCGLRFKRKDRMSYHVRSHDGSVGKPYICQSCGKGFSRPDHLNGHIKQVHTSERPHKCQQEVGDQPGVSSETPESLQETCNASFATRDRLRSHLACHEDKVPCQVCGKYLRAAYMADHLKKHSEGPSNFCTICNRGFSSASYLKVHVKTHHDVPLPQVSRLPEPIPNGGAAFHSARTYGIKGQKCSHLDQIESSDSYGDLSDASDLKTPEKQNANGSFPCEMAAAAARNKSEPEADRKYPCPECGSFFRSKSYLNKHIQKVHVRSLAAVAANPLGDLGSALGSPFSPQQNMSLLESFGFQIVQSAFASSLVDPDVDQQTMGTDGK
ncbi:POZ-, AT hook-, and zinc finger-containing protein 1 isoform X2 [Sceloporus undulatus]|uniref:POZ-, AT hook-, and zinc finger-containing protein 1 isoform X2 n=1 Tax=Sceloporus undulatus TaxID=8520 RepID=UPI001C4B3C10|nr:POZ-, AT hook-, and zinc finger-containing protein 1 isoform X2 [Sceloporus undulatus]